MASSIPAAATGGLYLVRESFMLNGGMGSYGTKMAEAVAPDCFTASATLAKTGRSRCVDPAFFGFVPPTTLVPIEFYQKLFAWIV